MFYQIQSMIVELLDLPAMNYRKNASYTLEDLWTKSKQKVTIICVYSTTNGLTLVSKFEIVLVMQMATVEGQTYKNALIIYLFVDSTDNSVVLG